VYELDRASDVRRGRSRVRIPTWDQLDEPTRSRLIAAYWRVRSSYDAGRTLPRELPIKQLGGGRRVRRAKRRGCDRVRSPRPRAVLVTASVSRRLHVDCTARFALALAAATAENPDAHSRARKLQFVASA
jgi:hypothetical protein